MDSSVCATCRHKIVLTLSTHTDHTSRHPFQCRRGQFTFQIEGAQELGKIGMHGRIIALLFCEQEEEGEDGAPR